MYGRFSPAVKKNNFTPLTRSLFSLEKNTKIHAELGKILALAHVKGKLQSH